MNILVLLGTWLAAIWLIRRDTAQRAGVSSAAWIPTLWVGILASRPLSLWLGLGGGDDTLEGSPLDRIFFFGMLAAAMLVLARRRLDWGALLLRNGPLLLFYGYLLISVTWANDPIVSFKRWSKESGNILVALIILTELDPMQALRAVFVRCAYVLVPLSVVYIRYFPELGRRYSIHSGMLEVTGVTTQKNSLGAMVLVCGLIFLWDWLERTRPGSPPRARVDRVAAVLVGATALWLLHQCDSKTSLVCLLTGGVILSAIRLPVLRRRIAALGFYVLGAALVFFALDSAFGISREIVASLGRDMTFTGRTDVWRELLAVRTDPLIGTGFMSFWDDVHYRSLLPKWVAFSAHNGYLEIYLAGGALGVGALVVLLAGTAARINRALAAGGDYAVVRFAVFVVALIANFSESNFACMTPVGFLFLTAALGEAPAAHATVISTLPTTGLNSPGAARPAFATAETAS